MASRSSPHQAGQGSPARSTSAQASWSPQRQQPGRRASDPLPRGLGWASAGLGIPPLIAPRWFDRFIGVGDAPRHRNTALVVGVQELAAAAGLLGQESPAWLWSRVAATSCTSGCWAGTEEP